MKYFVFAQKPVDGKLTYTKNFGDNVVFGVPDHITDVFNCSDDLLYSYFDSIVFDPLSFNQKTFWACPFTCRSRRETRSFLEMAVSTDYTVWHQYNQETLTWTVKTNNLPKSSKMSSTEDIFEDIFEGNGGRSTLYTYYLPDSDGVVIRNQFGQYTVVDQDLPLFPLFPLGSDFSDTYALALRYPAEHCAEQTGPD
jgi:hypothetical protein